jgi:SAM-dependent methyltransferase
VVRGVRRFVESEHYSGSFGYQWNRFARTQLDSANGTTRSRDAFVERTTWPLNALAGKRVLDAGCGMGRFAEVCADAGAEVYGIDLSSAVDAASANLGARANVAICQADILSPPFQPGSFDFIYSLGVLHHTPDTRQAFESLVPLLRPGGSMAIWVYWDRLARVMPGSELLRPLTSRLPKPLLLSLCRVAVPLYHVHRLGALGMVTSAILPTSMDPDPEWRVLDTFDWYSPRFQWKHSEPEVRRWFSEAGFTDLSSSTLPVGVSGRKPA